MVGVYIDHGRGLHRLCVRPGPRRPGARHAAARRLSRGGIRPRRGRGRRTGRSRGHRARRRAAHAVHGGDEGAPCATSCAPRSGVPRSSISRYRPRHSASSSSTGSAPAGWSRCSSPAPSGSPAPWWWRSRSTRSASCAPSTAVSRSGILIVQDLAAIAVLGLSQGDRAVAVGHRAARAPAGASPRPPAPRRRRPRGDHVAARHRPSRSRAATASRRSD